MTVGTPEIAAARNGHKAAASLHPVEIEVINHFVQFSRALGQSRSIAEIYGLLFMSPAPLSLDDLIERLQISRGSGSQGLNYLQDLGAVRAVYVAGRRKIHYEAVAELRNLAGQFLRRQVQTHFRDSRSRLDGMLAQAQKLSGPERAHAIARVKMLCSWEKNVTRVLPLALKLLIGKDE